MKLATFIAADGQTRVGVLMRAPSGDVLLDVTRGYAAYLAAVEDESRSAAMADARLPSDVRLILEGGERCLNAVRQTLNYAQALAAEPHDEQWMRAKGLLYDLNAVAFQPPILRPGKIISIGANYRSHMAEFDESNTDSESLKVLREGARVDYPPAFAKLSSTMIGHDQPIIYPKWTTQLDYEGELCVVIGKRCKNVEPDRYLEAVAGYTIMNDVSLRDLQMREMKRGIMLMAKNLDTTAPIGPFLVTKNEVADPQNLRIATYVNGEPRQSENTSQMVFNIATIIAYYSRMTLEPGDIFTTGSPAGVGITRTPPERYLLKPGDVVEIEIEGLGQLRNRIVNEI
jgi:acylpyruvate hydrolase